MKQLLCIIGIGMGLCLVGCDSGKVTMPKEQGWTISQIQMQAEIESLHEMIIYNCYRQNVLERVIMAPTKSHDLDTSGYYWEHRYYDSIGAYEQKFYERLTDINRQLGKP